jgi:capsular polysaccharide transport system permease protein
MSATVVDMRAAAAETEARHQLPSLLTHPAGRQIADPAGGAAPALVPQPRPSIVAAVAGRISPDLWSLALVVGLPTLAAAIYFLFIAADQYVAEFRFGLRASEPVRADAAAFFPGTPAPLQTSLDSYAVAQYIGSRAVIDDISRSLDLRAMFATPTADWPARLHLPATIEELVVYWRRQVDAFFDPTDGTITVRVWGFTPSDALRLGQAILTSSERLVNDLSSRARRDAMRYAERDVEKTERRLATALARLRDYRDKAGLIDPYKTADANAALVLRLRDELARTSADLSAMRIYIRGDSPALKLLEGRIDSLKAQLGALESETAGPAAAGSPALSRVIGAYEELESERQFAETAYQKALEALDRARANADRQRIYLADFVPPSLPEEPLYPHRLRLTVLVFVAAFVVWTIGSLTVRSVRDHL